MTERPLSAVTAAPALKPSSKKPSWRQRVPGWSLFRAIVVWGGVRGSASLYYRIFHRMRFEGLEHVPVTGPIVVVANHLSHLDPPLVAAVVGRRRAVAFMARHTLFQSWWFGRFIRYLGAFPVDRDAKGSEAMREAIARVQQGHAGLLFPEGTRQIRDEVGAFKPGFLLLVRRTDAAVIPVGLDGTFDAWPKGAARPKPGVRVAVAVGAAIPAADLAAMSGQNAADLVRERVAELKARAHELRA